MSPEPRRGWVTPAALALGGGIAWGWCFQARPPAGWSLIAFVPLALLSFRPRSGRWGWLHGFVAWIVAIPWIVPTLETFGGLPTGLSWFLLALLAAYLGSFDGIFVRAAARWGTEGSVARIIGLRLSLWILLEVARGWLLGGFPWNLAATAWVDVPGALPLSSWIGVLGVSALVVALPIGWVTAWRRRSWELALAAPMLAALLLTVADRWAGPPAEATQGIPVSVVQPNHRIVFDDARVLWDQYDDLIDTSRAECEEKGPRLIVWPESAAWPHSWSSSPRLREDIESLGAMGCRVLLNSSVREGDRTFNAALLIDSGGLAGRYDKRRLVPWGEHVPLGQWFPFIGKLARAAGDFTPGHGAGLLEVDGQRIAMAICYEIVFSRGVRGQVKEGATVLATITNDAWYGDSSAPHQHFRAARFRAAENGRPLIRAALTGISALVDPRGGVAAELGVGERGVLRAEVHGRTGWTLWTRTWPVVPSLALLVTTFAILRRPRRNG